MMHSSVSFLVDFVEARTMLRQIITKAFLPNFDRELGASVRREVGSMGKDLCPLQTASAFSFRPAAGPVPLAVQPLLRHLLGRSVLRSPSPPTVSSTAKNFGCDFGY